MFFGGDGDYECIWGEYVCFLGFHVIMGGLWVAKVGFGRLKVVIGGYEWLSGFQCLGLALKMQS